MDENNQNNVELIQSGIQIRKTIAIISTVVLSLTLAFALYKELTVVYTAIITLFGNCITWYFARSTALDKQK